jgi:hypothetical protein
MSIDLALPPEGAALEERGVVLRVGIGHGGPLELRVDDGLVFARFFGQEPRMWTDVSITSVIALFAANTPISTFLRRQGALPMRQLLLAALTADNESENASA